MATAHDVIGQFFQDSKKWKKDIAVLTFAERKQRFEAAQSILRNETFRSEIREMIEQYGEEIVLRSTDWETVINLRMCLVSLQALIERFQAVTDPSKKENKEEVYNPI
jgi:hypothetical protein